MARPHKLGLDYFPHDTAASGDEKLQLVEARFGNDGYAVFFKALEGIYKSPDVFLDLSDLEILAIWAKRANVQADRFIEVLDYCVSKDLFDPLEWDRRKLTSEHCREVAGHVTRQRVSEERKQNKTKLKETKLKERITRVSGMVSAGKTPQEIKQENNQECVCYAERIYLYDHEFAELLSCPDMGAGDVKLVLGEIKKASDWTLSKGRQHVNEAAFMRNWLKKSRADLSRSGNGNGANSRRTAKPLPFPEVGTL